MKPNPIKVWLSTLLVLWTLLATVKWYSLSRMNRELRNRIVDSVGIGEREIRVEGRPAIVYVPSIYKRTNATPLVLVFHGRSQRHDRFFQVLRLGEWAEKNGFILAVPAGLMPDGERQWEVKAERDVLFTDSVIERLMQDYNIDQSRVYTHGFSAGGYFSLFYAWKRSQRVAAFGMNSGGWIPWLPEKTSRKVPAIFVHGDRDEIITIGEMHKATDVLRAAGHEVRTLGVGGGGHEFFRKFLPNVWRFFNDHRLPTL